MHLMFVVLLGTFVVNAPTPAQQAPTQKPATPQQAPSAPPQNLSARVPPAKPADVKSIDGILLAIYDVISGPAGDRDWNRFRSLFIPEARLTSTAKNPSSSDVRLFSVDDFIQRAGHYFSTHPFYESAVVSRVQKFGNIAQVFSSYESRNALTEKPFIRGINSIQLFNDGARWWVLSILWDEESPNSPLPPEMATPSSAPATL